MSKPKRRLVRLVRKIRISRHREVTVEKSTRYPRGRGTAQPRSLPGKGDAR